MTKYYTQDSETGSIIDCFETLEQAKQAIIEYEEEDLEMNIFTYGFYEIREKRDDGSFIIHK